MSCNLMTKEISRKAPEGKFSLVLFDTFDESDWIEGVFDTLSLAKKEGFSLTNNKAMLKFYIYNDQGYMVGQGGSF